MSVRPPPESFIAASVRSPFRERSRGRAFYEFFAGCGMARAGLGEGWDCLFANDFDAMKGGVYRDNWSGGADLLIEDVNKVTTAHLPERPDLVWASFPCQDLSLAGKYGGIGSRDDGKRTRSGSFWPFLDLMQGLQGERRAPKLIVLENVYGVLTSNGGGDFAAIGDAFAGIGYRFGAMVIDARHFVPHSRPRVFIVAVKDAVCIPEGLVSDAPIDPWHPARMIVACEGLSENARRKWIWWNLATPEPREHDFVDLIDEIPEGCAWNSDEETAKLLSMMSEVNKEKVQQAKNTGKRMVGGVYKRTRANKSGDKAVQAEVRFDNVAGCLRTPSGGSSRQSILLVEGEKVRSRLLSPREAARLMGLPETFILPANYNAAYRISGDGVAVPVVSHLARVIFEPILDGHPLSEVDLKESRTSSRKTIQE
jgi:DNA (cytosine-5)-methyltransferase 1